MIHFRLLSAVPTQELLDEIRATGIKVRGFELPIHKFKKRKTKTHTEYIENLGVWRNPKDDTGEMKLSVNGQYSQAAHHDAIKTIVTLAEQHNIWVANSGAIIEGYDE